MSLENTIPKLPLNRVKEIDQTIIEVGIAALGGGRPYELIRKRKNSAMGALKKSYETMLDASPASLMSMVDVYLGDL